MATVRTWQALRRLQATLSVWLVSAKSVVSWWADAIEYAVDNGADAINDWGARSAEHETGDGSGRFSAHHSPLNAKPNQHSGTECQRIAPWHCPSISKWCNCREIMKLFCNESEMELKGYKRVLVL